MDTGPRMPTMCCFPSIVMRLLGLDGSFEKIELTRMLRRVQVYHYLLTKDARQQGETGNRIRANCNFRSRSATVSNNVFTNTGNKKKVRPLLLF